MKLIPKFRNSDKIGTYENPIELDEYVVYPYSVKLGTYYPTNEKKRIGHSYIKGESIDPLVENFSVDAQSKDPGYNLLTNNCSDATRELLEELYGDKMNPFLFTTPGDVRDYFREHGAVEDNTGLEKIYKERYPNTFDSDFVNVTKEEFEELRKAAININRKLHGKK